MARANRHFLPGHIWHITHRCHKREFLLKFSRDRNRWIELLFKAKKRYQLSVLNFIVTSNHIHLVVSAPTKTGAIPRTIQFVAGRLGQEYGASSVKVLSGKTVIMPLQ
jgi:putative transposase